MKIVTLMKTTAPLRLFRFPSAALCALAVTAIIPLSCVRLGAPSLPDDIPASVPDGTPVEVTVQSTDEPGTKSSWPGDPGRVDSFVLMAYRNACLDAFVGSEDGAAVSVRLLKGQSYHLYALAHVPGFVPPRQEADLAVLSIPAGDFGSADGLPMACRVPDFVPSADGQCLTLAFERLFARLTVRVEKGCLGLLQIGSVRLRQAASFLHPFAATDAGFSGPPDGGLSETLRESLSETALYQDGDYAGAEDLDRLNAGDSLVLYVPENRQGILLPGNEDPLRRIPTMLGDKAAQCTFLELSAAGKDGALLTGDACCRVYLGRNAADDFTVPRNRELRLTLFLSENLLNGGWGWRIDSNLAWDAASVTGWMAEGMHPVGDLYVGEGFRYAVRPSEDFLRAIGGDFSRCSLRFCPEAGVSSVTSSQPDADAAVPDTSLLFTAWEPSGDGVWYAGARCRRPVSGQLRFCLDGRGLFALEPQVCVKSPRFVLQAPQTVQINADTLSYCSLDLQDGQGRSLCENPLFEPALFKPVYSLSVSPGAGAPPLSAFSQLKALPPSASHACGGCLLGISHAGRDSTVQRFLTETLQRDEVFGLQVRDARCPAEAACPFRTDIRPVRIRLCEDPQAPANGCLLVDNPSALPLDLGLVLSARCVLPQEPLQEIPVPRPLHVLSGLSDFPDLAEREKISTTTARDSVALRLSAVFRRSFPGRTSRPFAVFGIEPSLRYGALRDKRLDGKVQAACDLSWEEVPLSVCVFDSRTERWGGEQLLPETVWLRYSAYDDVGTLDVTAGFSASEGLPTVRLVADKGTPMIHIAYFGYMYASLYVYPNGKLWGGDYLYQTSQHYVACPPDAIPADGQTYSCSTRYFTAALSALYEAAVQDDNTIMGTNHYQHHPYPERIEYSCSIAWDSPDRILVPVLSGSLNFVFHHPQDNVDLPVSSVFTGFYDRSLQVYDY